MKSQKLFPFAKMVEKDGGVPINLKLYDVFGGTLNTNSRTHSLQLGSCFKGSCCIGPLHPDAIACLVSRDIRVNVGRQTVRRYSDKQNLRCSSQVVTLNTAENGISERFRG